MNLHAMRSIAAVGLALFLGASTPAEATPIFSEGEAKPNRFWWPNQLDLSPLRAQQSASNPYGDDFNYAKAFAAVDLDALKADIDAVLTDSQEWWPADYGNYGPFFIRMAWHSAGTYRVSDGRGGAGGGQLRFNPLNSWPDNANLDKARRLLWPIKKKYGTSVSWSDLMVLAGNVAMENMGFTTLGFAGGRVDDWEADLVYWGPETKLGDDQRHDEKGNLRKGLAASQMGLIYVNPQGPNGNPDFTLAANAIRTTFGRMAMNDEETVALIAGGHTFGKAHGARKAADGEAPCVGADAGGAAIEKQGQGWENRCGKGHSEDTITSGLEGAWTSAPARWTHMYLTNLYAFEWEQTTSPTGAIQFVPTDASAKSVPDAHIEGKYHLPIMFTTDLALRYDEAYGKITKRWLENPKEFEDAFARAWFKLTHRDMGPRARYVGAGVPAEVLGWQDPVPAANGQAPSEAQIAKLKKSILKADLSVSELVRTAWASAASFRNSDMRGGANGARLRLAPQNTWAVNDPAELEGVLAKLEKIQKSHNKKAKGDGEISMADLIVLAGATAIEKAAEDAGIETTVPFVAGRGDASQEATNVDSFNVLKPEADAFRNYFNAAENTRAPTDMMVDKAAQLSLTVPEMTVLIGGMRALDANAGGASHGVFTDTPGVLTNDFFVNLLDMGTVWTPSSADEGLYEGKDRSSGELKWTATPVDLVFGSNAELRAVVEAYAFDESKEKFVNDFVAAWTKVMHLDRFDLKHSN
ncbi:MAG: catalase/peroxidase HPI [Myxococcota bacterium]|nr:catalase/peroxidase HPI [Myxococcota bacterium]